MLEIHEIRELVIKLITKEVTEAEMQQLEEWASLSTENRIWLQRFYDSNWVAARITKFRSFDPDKNRDKMWAGIVSRRIVTRRQNRKFRTGRRVVTPAILFVGIVLPFLEHFFLHVTPSTKTAQGHLPNSNQRNEKEKPGRPVNSSGIVATYTSTDNTSAKIVSVMMPAGGLLTYTLPDNSNVFLNAVSNIKFPEVFKGSIRHVKITGEAYFEVRPDSFRPFQVVANGVKIEVFSGRFNIRVYPEDGKTVITALEGNIHIVTGPINTILYMGQSAIIEPKRKLTVIPADVDKVTGWKKKLFVFKNEHNEFVAHELARWYGLTVQFNARSKTRISWTGSRQDKITEVIKSIMSQHNIRMKLRGNQLIIN